MGIPLLSPGTMADDALATTQRLDSVLSALNHSLMRNGATGMGTSLDPYTQVEVNYGRLLNEQQLRALYRGSWFIRRVVDLLPQDMTKTGVEVLLHDGSNTRIVNKAMQVYHDGGQRQNPYEKRMGCNEARRLALTYARWFGMGYIVLRVNGGENPAKPLKKVTSFEGVSVLDRYSLRPAIGTIDVHNPEFYQVSRHDAPGGFGGELPVMQRIHASRVLAYKGAMIHPYDIQLEGDGGHDSVVQQVYEAFTRHFMAKDAISKGLDSYSLFKVAISGLSTLLQSPNGTQTLTEYLNTVAQQMSLHRILVQDTEASKSEFQERSFAGVAENFKFFVDDLIAATGYPHYKIYGSVGKAGLADSGGAESRAWAETVRAYQSMELADNDRILFHAIFEALGRVPKQWKVVYPSIYSATPEEEATLAKTQADTLTALTREGVITTRQAYQALATGQPLENVLKPLDEADVLTPVEEEAAQGPSAEEELTTLLGGGAPAEPATPAAPPEEPEAVEDVPEEEPEAEQEEPLSAEDEMVALLAEEEQQTDAADNFTPPKAAQRNAQRVLDWRERYGDEVKGMTAVGWTRARQLASGDPISLDTVKRMAQFNRHRQNRTVAPENKGTPWKDAGHVAWLGWGGTEGVDWAISVSRNANDTTDLWDDHADAEDILEYLDAEADPEDLVLLAARVVFEAGDWKILGIKNLEIEPGEGLTFQVVVEQDGTGKRLLQQVEYNAITNEWVDSVIEGRTDVWRIDAPRKGSKRGKRTEAPKCKAGKKCGMTCIKMERDCHQNPTGVVEEALKTAVGTKSKGGAASKRPVIPLPSGVKRKDNGDETTYTFEAGDDILTFTIKPEPRLAAANGTRMVDFEVNYSLAAGELIDNNNAVAIASKARAIMQHDASQRPNGFRYSTLAFANDDRGSARALLYSKEGFSTPGALQLEGSKGIQYAVVKNGRMVPSDANGKAITPARQRKAIKALIEDARKERNQRRSA